MKMRLIASLAGLAISFAVPALAQEKDTVNPQITRKILAIGKAWDEANNNNDAAPIAALFTEDAIFVTDGGPVHGRQAIEKWFSDVFQGWHAKDHLTKFDGNAPHMLGAAGDELWATGEWSETGQGKTGGPIQRKGYWAVIYNREGDEWKIRMLSYNVTPAPPAAETK